MSTALLKEYITEVMMTQNVIRKDPEGTGQSIVRKLVTFKKSGSRFPLGTDVPTELTPDGNVVLDDKERWEPDFSKTKRRTQSRARRKVHHLA